MQDRCIGFIELHNINTSWRDILHLGVRKKYKKGEAIPQGDHLFFLEKGAVRLTHNTREGKEKILWYIRSGCVFGETPFFDPMPSTSESIHLCTTPCIIYLFSKECVATTLATQYPSLLLDLLPSLARKVRILSNQASSLYLDDVVIRTCKFLAQRIVPKSDPPIVQLNISRQEMASLLGIHRITLFKIFKQLEECGICLPHERDSFSLPCPEEFFRLVNT